MLSTSFGCHKRDKSIDSNALGPATPTESAAPQPTANFTADPTEIDLGQSVVLNWRTMNANSVTIDGIGNVPVNGT
ncbi:MAG: flagellar motor protein MotB, partial [Acidobacteriaceae bacterium]|nr:flagellar motor protein MotB [Acidobacteriaceae bacterium]